MNFCRSDFLKALLEARARSRLIKIDEQNLNSCLNWFFGYKKCVKSFDSCLSLSGESLGWENFTQRFTKVERSVEDFANFLVSLLASKHVCVCKPLLRRSPNMESRPFCLREWKCVKRYSQAKAVARGEPKKQRSRNCNNPQLLAFIPSVEWVRWASFLHVRVNCYVHDSICVDWILKKHPMKRNSQKETNGDRVNAEKTMSKVKQFDFSWYEHKRILS